uniref:beta-lactamase regulator AmpE n=1 Tax=Escherichia coli TaxID=562 RepID=UPI001FCEA68E
RGCNPAYSKSIHTWLRFGEIMRGSLSTSQYQVLTRLAQFSLAREPHVDKVETPKAAVSMAKKTSFVVVVVIALLTIYGALV